MNNKKIIVALFGAAGAGKDTLQKEIVKQSPDLFQEIISSTTRPKREYEIDGKDYHFISELNHQQYLNNNDYLEHTEFRGWYYGTLKSSIAKNCFNIGVFNIFGVKQLLQLPHDEYRIIPIFVIARQKTRLLRQLNREASPDCEEIVRRFITDAEDLKPENTRFWYIMEPNDGTTIEESAAKTIKDIYEYELGYFIRAE